MRKSKNKPGESEQVTLLRDELDVASSLDAVSLSEGGKALIEALTKDIVTNIERLSSYKDKSHIELIALCADMSNKLTIVRSITRAKKNKEFLEGELMEALKE